MNEGRKNSKEAWYLNYFDQSLGLFVSCTLDWQGIGREGRWTKTIASYVGPQGISANPDENIGRFTKPLIGLRGIVFDRQLSRFFRIDYCNKEVKAGPKIEQEIVQVRLYGLKKNNQAMFGPTWNQPQRRVAKHRKRPNRRIVGHIKSEDILQDMYSSEAGWEIALDNSGMIYKIDTETLELTEPLGRLPWPGTCGLLAYNVRAISIEGKHAATIAAGIGPDIFRPGFLVFDEAGNQIGEEWGDIELLKFAGGPGLSVANFVLETLHPTILQLVTYFTALRFDGADGPKSLFVLPNSLAGRTGAELSEEDIVELIFGLWVILPSLAISLLLAWRVEKDARKVGLSGSAKSWWLVATVAFGLAAYITYRLTRPTIDLVTCANCGRARRPDMERCHQCGSKWLVPELIAPLWRVIEKHQPTESDLISAEKTE
jgi:hypothetical protein